MKTYSKLLISALLLMPMIFSSCEEKSNELIGEGIAEFSVSLPSGETKSAKGTDSVETALHLMISIEDARGNPILTDKLIPLYSFGTDFLSENIKIKTGEFRLTKFLVINASGDVVYAAPITGSPLAYLVLKPLPLPFRIVSGEVTRIVPEVLAVNGQTPDQFGYAAFGMQVIKPLEFWTYCIIDNPLSQAPTLITTANLTISTPSGWKYSFRLQARLNHLIIRGGSDIYYFQLEKENYPPQTMRFSARELLATTPDNPLVLKIPFDPQYRVMILQPGPVRGIDAMVSNLEPDKNFGDHKYFETTFLTEPVLTVMRSNRSLISFNRDTLPKSAVIKKVILTLTYDIPVPFDSIYMPRPVPTPVPDWYGAVFQRIVEPWDEHKVTWNTQPKATETNQVYLSPFIKNANMIDVDVTRLFVSPDATTAANYGILFRLWPSEKFPGFRFASSDYPVATMRPKLTIYYAIGK